jgi:hypothetical protein
VINVFNEFRNWTVFVEIVAGSMFSLKVTKTFRLRGTPVTLLAGLTEVTVGGVVSDGRADVVNAKVKFTAKAFPATSVTPLLPPLTVSV